jgi:hypothetical protein
VKPLGLGQLPPSSHLEVGLLGERCEHCERCLLRDRERCERCPVLHCFPAGPRAFNLNEHGELDELMKNHKFIS